MAFPDLVLTHATFLTLDDGDRVAGAVAVTGGLITAVGTAEEVRAGAGPATQVVDLGGAVVVPGFVDAHSHVSIGAPYIRCADLQTPPVGAVTTVADVVARLHASKDRGGTAPGGYVVGWGYYAESMTDGGVITAAMLDEEFPDHRVVIVHVSGHGGVVNSRVLEDAGIHDGAEDVDGGTIARYPGTRTPNGVLWEGAWMPLVSMGFLDYGRAEFDEMLSEYARWGMTTVQDGAASWPQTQQVRDWASEAALPVDVRSLITWTDLQLAIDAGLVDTTVGGHTVQGVKLIVDGSPQGRTALVSEEYVGSGPSGEKHWHGIANMDPDTVDAVVEKAYRNGFQVFAHVNGDAAIDSLLDGHRAAVAAGAQPVVPTVPIHSQVMRLDQLDDYVEQGWEPSMFTVHTYLFGDTHVENLGRERADGISPMRSALDRGLRPSNHSDYPITPINPLLLLWSSVSRTTIDGVVLGAGERVSPLEGLRALTLHAAIEHRTESDRGSIEVGKLADLAVLDANPLEVAVDAIAAIAVVRTYKRGAVVHDAM